MFFKMRDLLRDQAEAAPTALNEAERSKGVTRSNLPDPEDYDEKLEAMTVCETLELGLNELNEAGSALYIRHVYNLAVVDNFLGDEFFGADRTAPMKERMRASVKEVQKLSARAKAAVGQAGCPFGGRAPRQPKRQKAQGGISLQEGPMCPRDTRRWTGLQVALEPSSGRARLNALSAKRWGIMPRTARTRSVRQPSHLAQ